MASESEIMNRVFDSTNNALRTSIQTNEGYIVTKTITFDGTSGKGASGSNATIFNFAGHVIANVWATCSSSLTGATAVISLGVNGGPNQFFISNTTSTGITANTIWADTSPANADAFPAAKLLLANGSQNTIVTIHSTANTTGGTLTFYCQWRPLSTDGSVTAA